MRNLVQESLIKKSIIWDNGEEILALALSSQYDTSPRKSPTTVYPYDMFKDRKNLIDEILVCLSDDANKKKLSKATVFEYRYAICSILKMKIEIKSFIGMDANIQTRIKSHILGNQILYTHIKSIFNILRKCFKYYNPNKECHLYHTKRHLIPKAKNSTLIPTVKYAEIITDRLEKEIKNIEEIFRAYQRELCLYQATPKKPFFSLENLAKTYVDSNEEEREKIKRLYALIYKKKISTETIDTFWEIAREGINILNLSSIQNIVYFIEDVVLNNQMEDFCFSVTPMTNYTNLDTQYTLDLFLKKFFYANRKYIR